MAYHFLELAMVYRIVATETIYLKIAFIKQLLASTCSGIFKGCNNNLSETSIL